MKNQIKFLVIFFVLSLIFIKVSYAQTQDELQSRISTSNIVYPIVELGSCKDQGDCANFCSVPANMVACVNYAEKNNLLAGEDLRISKAVVKRIADGTTPGGCKSKAECEAYCTGRVDNIKECVTFADELKIIPEKELTEAKKILSALEKGVGMPGSCKTKGECENYCTDTSHIDECLSFAEAADILPKDELDQAKKVASFLKEGKTPGKCQNKKSCDEYCSQDANFTECVSFAETAGLISKEDADVAKKAGGVGPGGCKSKESCAEYCNKQENIDVCTNFGIEKGLISEEDQKMIKSGIDEMIKALGSLPPEMRDQVESCMKSSMGEEQYNRILNKTDKPTKEIGGKIQSCFASLPKQGGPQGGITGGPSGGKPPSADDINKMIPDNAPKEVRDQIQNQINNGVPQGGNIPNRIPGGMPDNIPNDIPGGIPNGGPSGQPGATGPSCSDFAGVPSAQYCSMVPAGPARDKCIQCKS